MVLLPLYPGPQNLRAEGFHDKAEQGGNSPAEPDQDQLMERFDP